MYLMTHEFKADGINFVCLMDGHRRRRRDAFFHVEILYEFTKSDVNTDWLKCLINTGKREVYSQYW